jgi:L-arabinose isomerase
MIVQDITCIKPLYEMPNLPVARVMWQPEPDLLTGVRCWIMAGGAHHSVLTTQVTAQMMEDWADIMGIEFVHITKDTTVKQLKEKLFFADFAWRLK